MALLALLLSVCALFQGVKGDVDSSSLLWPIPKEVTPGATNEVKALDPDKFHFTTAINSALLNEAFQRYTGLIFKTPTPFFPDGASTNMTIDMTKLMMPMLTVKVSSGDETLGPDVDESCKTQLASYMSIISIL